MKSIYKKGDRVIGFDSVSWMKTGDIGDNSQFEKEATILSVRKLPDYEWVADLMFDDGTISNGHFQVNLTPIVLTL